MIALRGPKETIALFRILAEQAGQKVMLQTEPGPSLDILHLLPENWWEAPRDDSLDIRSQWTTLSRVRTILAATGAEFGYRDMDLWLLARSRSNRRVLVTWLKFLRQIDPKVQILDEEPLRRRIGQFQAVAGIRLSGALQYEPRDLVGQTLTTPETDVSHYGGTHNGGSPGDSARYCLAMSRAQPRILDTLLAVVDQRMLLWQGRDGRMRLLLPEVEQNKLDGNPAKYFHWRLNGLDWTIELQHNLFIGNFVGNCESWTVITPGTISPELFDRS